MLDKFYLVEEEELIDLIATYYKMMMLERDGVDNWCKENNIVLIRIPYTEYENIDEQYMRRIIERNGWRELL